MNSRIATLQDNLGREAIDAYVSSSPYSVRYYTSSFSGGFLIVPCEGDPTLLVNPLEEYAALDLAKGCVVEPYQKPELLRRISEKIRSAGCRSVGFDELSYQLLVNLAKCIPEVKFDQRQDFVWGQRRFKDEGEIRLMERAGKLADVAMEALRGELVVGVSEYQLAAEASRAMIEKGAESHGFDPIIASGPSSAYPHSSPSERRVKKGDLIVVDIGATHKGYRSDITRTFIAGRPNKKQLEIYETVLRAHDTAYAEMRADTPCKSVDSAARKVIEEAGYGSKFVHSLGHGVGLEVHEPPAVSSRSEETLGAGDVVSDEPGIYIHGYGGVRIEDTVLIMTDGSRRLTNAPRGLDVAVF